jgi:GAF domain-containing protein
MATDREAERAGQGEDRSTLDDALAAEMSRLAMNFEDEGDLQATLAAIVRAAVGTVPGAEDASISMVRERRHVTTTASTSDLPRRNDQAQYETGEGPCLDTLYERHTVHVPDMASEVRWPAFSARAFALGVGSMLSVQLYVKGDDLGALNLLNPRPHAFDDDSEHIALLFASHAAIAIIGARKEEQLRDALSRRDVIGQAMGILMERYRMTAQQAFSVLIRVSQNSNRKLFLLAEEIVETRDLPASAQPPEPAEPA